MDEGLALAELPPEISASFVAEARGYLPVILEGLAAPFSQERLAEAYRLAHTIRSSAAMLGFTGLSQLAELLEGDLEDLQAGLPAAPSTLAQLQRSVGRIGRLLDAVAGEPVDVEAMLADEVADRTGSSEVVPAPAGRAAPVLQAEPASTGRAAPVLQAEPAGRIDSEEPIVPALAAPEAGEVLPATSGPRGEPRDEAATPAASGPHDRPWDKAEGPPLDRTGGPEDGPAQPESERLSTTTAEHGPTVSAAAPDEPRAPSREGARAERESVSKAGGTAHGAGESGLPERRLERLLAALDPGSTGAPVAAGVEGLVSVEEPLALLDALAETVLALGRECSAGGLAPAAVRQELAAWLEALDRRLGPAAPAGGSSARSEAALELDPAGAAEAALRQTIEAELRFQIEEEVRAQLAANAAEAAPAGLSLLGRFRPVASRSQPPATGEAGTGVDQRPSQPEAERDGDTELRAIFAVEAAEHLKRIDADLLALESAPGSVEILRSLRRTVHTLKGAAAMMGMEAVAALAHSIEDRLDTATSGDDGRATSPLEPHAYSALLGDLDRLEQLIRGEWEPEGEHAGALHDASAEPAAAAGGGSTATQAGAARVETQTPVAVPVRLDRLDDLLRVAGEAAVAVAAWPALLSAAGSALSDVRRAISRVEALVSELEAERRAPFGRGAAMQMATVLRGERGETAEWVFDPLELDRYTPADQLTRELAEIAVETHAAERELAAALESAGELVTALRRHSSTLQEQLLEARLVPLDELMGRLQRAVRSVALRRGKEAGLVFDGHGVAVDRAILDSITEALVHLVRNAVDHGIEPPEARVRAGKARAGTVHVRARQERGEVYVEVADDGAGIDLERLAAAARTAGKAAGTSSDELMRLMFEPGISTAGGVDEISGRGVGLDAVRDAIARVRGTIEVASEPGQGTLFRLTFPVTLAQARVVMAEVAGNPVAVPVAHVRRIARHASLDVERLGREEIARLDGEAFPVTDLAAALGYTAEEPLPANPPVLFVEAAGRRAAFLAGAVGSEQEVVIQPTGRHLRSLRGVAGATVLQDGRVALLLHLPDLLEAPPQARALPEGLHAGSRAMNGDTLPPAEQQGLEVLVVDDSPTIRKLLVRMLKDLGWQPREAKDGAEALEEIRLRRPDVVLADVEMPRLDGYGLLAALRARPETADLPVLMLTSRTAARHRQRAAGLGANGYLTKPYRPADVVAALRAVYRAPGAGGSSGPAAAGAVA